VADVPGLPHEELAARLAEAYRLIGELSARVERLEKRLARDVNVVEAVVVGQPL